MGKRLHHHARQINGVLVTLEGRNGAGGERGAIHDAGIQLDLAKEVGEPTVADRVVVRVGFDPPDSGDHGIDGGAAGAEDVHPIEKSNARIFAADEQEGH